MAEVVPGEQPPHRVGDDVELEVGPIDPVAPLELGDHVGSLLQDEFVEPSRVLHVVPPPVIRELEAGEVPGAIVELAHAAEGLVPIAANAERSQDVKIGLRLDRQPEEAHAHAIQHARRLHGVTELGEGTPLGHRERDEPGAVRSARVRVGASERAPHHPAGARIHELRAADAGHHDHGVASGVSALGRAVVEAPKVWRRCEAGGAARHEPCGYQRADRGSADPRHDAPFRAT